MVKLIDSCVIKPAEQTPNGLMSLSEFDQVGAITHAAIVYFYQSPVDFDSAIAILKDSLSKVLVTFYPLAGRLRDIGGGRFEVDCKPVGAQFLVAESESTIDFFGDFRPTPKLRALTPLVDSKAPVHEQPLLLVQVTKLSCGGICLGLAISQIMVDGSSGFHFTNEWARLARGEQLKNPPFLDRTVLQMKEPVLGLEPCFDHPEYGPPPVLIGCSDASEEIMKETAMVMLKLKKQDIEKLKKKANDGKINGTTTTTTVSTNHNSLLNYSRYEAVAGHMWRCACKARRNASQQLTRLYFPMDVRNRMEPPLPQFYFGNAIYRAAATSTSGELITKPLSYASSKIREAKAKATDEYLRSSMLFLKNIRDVSQCRNFHSPAPGAFHGNPNMDINNSWGRLASGGVDFGWGEEIYGGTAALGFDGKSIIMQGSEKDGSFLIMLHLQVAHMEDFKKFFYEDI